VSETLVVVVIGVGTYAIRVSFIAALGTRPISPTLARPLKYVAPAVLAALVIPAVVLSEGAPDLAPSSNPKFLAAVAAGLVAWRTRNVAATILVGMGLLWLLQAIA
jgi:branched-subunit amino acid transport protein